MAAGTATWTLTQAPYHFVRNIAQAQEGPTIKVGILHSLSGTIAIIERSLHNAELLAIEEINANGGVLGKQLEPVIEDPQSMVQVFNEKAKKLLLEDQVVAVSVATLQPAVSRCCRCSRSTMVCYLSDPVRSPRMQQELLLHRAVPNQQLDDFVPWIIKSELRAGASTWIGANYIYPKETNREVKALL